jgi:hypothetical protein
MEWTLCILAIHIIAFNNQKVPWRSKRNSRITMRIFGCGNCTGQEEICGNGREIEEEFRRINENVRLNDLIALFRGVPSGE